MLGADIAESGTAAQRCMHKTALRRLAVRGGEPWKRNALRLASGYAAVMRNRLAYLTRLLDTSIWLIPAVFCLVGLGLGALMLWLDARVAYHVEFMQSMAMPVASARQVLSVIAGSVISVGGVAFSVTMVALTLASGQYGPKVLRHFLEDNDSKVSLGLFLATYVYSLVVLTGYSTSHQPHLSVITALLLALLAVLGFIRFIHRTATDLQADEIVQRIGARLRHTLALLVNPDEPGRRSTDTLAWRRHARGHRPYLVAHTSHGYIQTVDYPGLLRWAQANHCCIEVRPRAGDFVIEGACAFKIYGCSADTVEDAVEHLNSQIIVGPVRTSAQDPEYPITQLNQLAARALSPGINDPGTAISCIDAFTLAIGRIVDSEFPGHVFHDADGGARLLIRSTHFDGLLKAVFAPLRQFSSGNIGVQVRLLEALCRLAEQTARPDRLRAIGRHGRLIMDGIDTLAIEAYDLRDLRQRARRLQNLVNRLD